MSEKEFTRIDRDAHDALIHEIENTLKRAYDHRKPSDRRDRAARVVYSLTKLIMSNAIEFNDPSAPHLAVESMKELIYALNDLDQGKMPSLFNREIKTPNNNTKTGQGEAYDLLIACRYFLMQTLNKKADIAESEIQNRLYQAGINLNVNGIVRAHNREDARNSRRLDARFRVIRDQAEYEKILSSAITTLSADGVTKKSHKRKVGKQ